MTTVAKRREAAQPEIDKALVALALAGGNSVRAAESLGKSENYANKVRVWKQRHAARYVELQQEIAPQIAERIAAEAEELAILYAEAERKALEVAIAKIEDLDADKASGAARNFSTGKALQVDKVSSPLRGRPTVIHETRDATGILATLAARLGLELAVDSTAEPIDADTTTHKRPNGREIPLVAESHDANAR